MKQFIDNYLDYLIYFDIGVCSKLVSSSQAVPGPQDVIL
jgi:hypothetical protein